MASAEFWEQLREIDGTLDTYEFAAESYDAVILTALAAIAAGSDAGGDIAAEMVVVSRDGAECDTFADCKQLLEGGDDIDYQGASGPIEFFDNGDISVAEFGIYRY